MCWEEDAGDGVAGREGRPNRMFVDEVMEDMQTVGVRKQSTEGNGENGVDPLWRPLTGSSQKYE